MIVIIDNAEGNLMIIITGATGQLGSSIVRALGTRSPGTKIVAVARDPEKAKALGVEVRQGDFAKPETLASAFAGASQILLVSSNAAAYGGDPIAQHRAAIDAAKQAGAKRVLYTSHVAASETSLFPPMHTHAQTEKMLEASGMPWTSLRNGFYAASALQFIGEGLTRGLIAVPADGKVAWTTHLDLAEGAAAVLSREGAFEGVTPLVASEALDMADIARLASDVVGHPVRREIVDDEAFAEKLKAFMPPHVIGIAMGFYRASRAGEFGKRDGTLEQLLGRKPQTARDWLR